MGTLGPMLDPILNRIIPWNLLYQVDKVFFTILSVILEVTFKFDIHSAPGMLLRGTAVIIGLLSLTPQTLLGPPKDFFNQERAIGAMEDSAKLNSSYDFVIVGGGLAGCLIAKRLSDENFTVLLIHGPGGIPNVLLRVPLFSFANYGDPEYDFQYEGPSISTSHWKNKKVVYNSGRMLGGSQVLSAQMWSYGKSGDYDCWKRFTSRGDKFNYGNIRKFGAVHEKADRNIQWADFEYGHKGEIHLSHPDRWDPYTANFAEQFEKAGASITGTRVVPDHNSDQLGFGKIVHAVETDSGYVSSPTRAFFEPGYKRDKLHIITRHMVTKILIDNTSTPKRATGVEVYGMKTKKTFRISARIKVVLTAGAIRSPQLLTLSGVGPKEVMSKWNVTPLVTREGVGQNLHDHYDIGSAAVCFPKNTKRFVDTSLWRIIQFTLTQRGPIRAPYGTNSLGFFASTSNRTTCKNPSNRTTCAPDFELIFQQIGSNTQVAAKHFRCAGASYESMVNDYYNMNKNKSSKPPPYGFNDLFNPEDCIMFTPTLLHPEGRGQITLTSSNPLDKPIVDLVTTASERDMLLFGELWQTVKRIANGGFVDKRGAFNNLVFDECKGIPDRESYEFGACQAKPFMKTAWHMSGTCRLGNSSDPMAVVDEDFNVIGVGNLSLADGSILPCPTSGHMIATVAALAEMAACQLLKEQNKMPAKCNVGVL